MALNEYQRLEIHKEHLTLGGKPFYLASGDMHYFRCLKGGWERRLRLMKDFGLTAVQTYVPWALHEPEEGRFDFEGDLDLAAFLELCDRIGLKVLLRPSPYMCSEWDYGGLPYWLIRNGVREIRTLNPDYMRYLRRYTERLAKEFLPYLSTRGGPIIAVAVENEYGSFGDDNDYIGAVGDMLTELGVDVPLYTANGGDASKMVPGTRKEYWTAVDTHVLDENAVGFLKQYQPDKPVFVAELWGGRSQQWGGRFLRQKPETVANVYKDALESGAFVNFYMFCGGTTFGFHNGALVGRYTSDAPEAPNRYIPFATSYDVDAPITEHGQPTEKYYLCKQALKDYLTSKGIPFEGTDDETEAHTVLRTQGIRKVHLTRSADLLHSAEALATNIRESRMPLTFEEMGQDYGFMLYQTEVAYTGYEKMAVSFDGLHDRALVYANGRYIGCAVRDREKPLIFPAEKNGVKLEILVENMGRVNMGHAMLDESKGICGFVKIDEVIDEETHTFAWNFALKTKWRNISLPCRDMGKADFGCPATDGRPAVFEGYFHAVPGVDTFFDSTGWTKGFVEINGFNIGRYWSIGPQKTLYVPGELLKEENRIRIVELEGAPQEKAVSFSDSPSLDALEKTCDLV